MTTVDPFWIARTEDAGGLIRMDSRLPNVDLWRRYRLVTDLTDRLYRRCGLTPYPCHGPILDDLYTMPLASADCDLGDRAFGRISGTVHADGLGSGDAVWAGLVEEKRSHPFPDGYGWARWVDEVSALLGLDRLAAEPGHERCRHARADAAFPLMWHVAVMLRSAEWAGWGSGNRALYAAQFTDVANNVGPQVEVSRRFDREGRWLLLGAGSGCCGLSPRGLAHVPGHLVDLAAMSRAGASVGELAATVEDLLAREDLTPAARRRARMTRLAERAGLPTARMIPEADPPDEITIFAGDDELVVTVGADAGPAVADSALAVGVGLTRDRDLHLVLPAGREHPTLHRIVYLDSAVQVWLHDGYRVMPIPTPAEADIEACLGREPWTVTKHTTVPDEEEGLTHRWEIVRSTSDGPRPVVLTTGAGTLTLIRETADLAGPDDLLRCVDQWAWLRANRHRSTEFDGLDEHLSAVDLDARQARAEPSVPALIEALDSHRARVMLRLDGEEVATWPVCSAVVTTARPEPPRGRRLLQAALRDHAARYGAESNNWPSHQAAVFASAQAAYHAVAARGHIEPGFTHTTSHQAFALNVFAPTGAAGAARTLTALGLPVVRAEQPGFAYRDPKDRLLEARPTVADVLLSGTTADGLRVAALILVRLTEDGFESCTGFTDTDNPWRDTCRVDAPFGGHPDTCRLLHRRGLGQPGPRYQEVLNPDSPRRPDGGCPYRAGTEQMRMVALATALRADGEYDRIVVALCNPGFQEPIRRRWDEHFPTGDGVTVAHLPIEAVVAVTGHHDAALLRERYGIATH